MPQNQTDDLLQRLNKAVRILRENPGGPLDGSENDPLRKRLTVMKLQHEFEQHLNDEHVRQETYRELHPKIWEGNLAKDRIAKQNLRCTKAATDTNRKRQRKNLELRRKAEKVVRTESKNGMVKRLNIVNAIMNATGRKERWAWDMLNQILPRQNKSTARR